MLGRLSAINTQPKEVLILYLLMNFTENYTETFLFALCKMLPSHYKTFFPGWKRFVNMVL